MTKGRITFGVLGYHRLTSLVKDYLISLGWEYTNPRLTYEAPAVLLVGSHAGLPDPADGMWLADFKGKVLLLSVDDVYSDRDFDLQVREQDPMREDCPILIPSSLEVGSGWAVESVRTEMFWLNKKNVATMVLRIFQVYGPDIPSGLVHDLVTLVTPPEIYSPGYQVRTFLHQDDFKLQVLGMVKRLLSGSTGIYNVGSDETISIKRLVDSIHQLKYGVDTPADVVKLTLPKYYRWWVIPDLTRTKALTRWIQTKSLRLGLWDLVENGYPKE